MAGTNKIRRKRNNQLAENGLLYDRDGQTFGLTQWYKDHNINVSQEQTALLLNILQELKKLNIYMHEITGIKINDEDIPR